MIWPDSRLAELVTAIEEGQPVDFDRLAALQMADIVNCGSEFAKDAVLFQEQEDRIVEQYFNTGEWPSSERIGGEKERAVG